MFRGFLPRENKERKPIIQDIINCQETIILYEAPHRLLDTLSFLLSNLGDRKIAVCRELTKLYEEIYRGSISESVNYFQVNKPRGEFVLVIEGKRIEDIEEEKKSIWIDLSIEEHILSYINNGISKKEAIKMVAKDRNLPKNEIYKFSTDL